MNNNGDAFQAFVDGVGNFLQTISVLDYYQSPIPSEVDQWFDQTVGSFQSLTPDQRSFLQVNLAQSQRALFGIYGHRNATRAVRKESEEFLFAGLTGLVIANYEILENRRIEVSLAIFHHCARVLSVDPAALFQQGAKYALPVLADLLIQFGRRTDINLKKYGWKAMNSQDGIVFRFSW